MYVYVYILEPYLQWPYSGAVSTRLFVGAKRDTTGCRQFQDGLALSVVDLLPMDCYIVSPRESFARTVIWMSWVHAAFEDVCMYESTRILSNISRAISDSSSRRCWPTYAIDCADSTQCDSGTVSCENIRELTLLPPMASASKDQTHWRSSPRAELLGAAPDIVRG